MIKSSHILTFSFGAGVTALIMLGLGYQLDGDMGLCKLEASGNSQPDIAPPSLLDLVGKKTS